MLSDTSSDVKTRVPELSCAVSAWTNNNAPHVNPITFLIIPKQGSGLRRGAVFLPWLNIGITNEKL